MIKAKKFDLEDSNIANLGSDLDKKVRPFVPLFGPSPLFVCFDF